MKRFICVLMCIFAMFNSAAFAAGGNNPILQRLRAADSNSALILMYHKLSEKAEENGDFCIKPREFEEDIKLLCESGYTFLTASELAAAKKERGGRKIAVITFDDGYESDYVYALPILEKYGAKATFFVFGGAIGSKEYMMAEQVKLLSQSKCAEIGNHSFELHSKSIAEVKKLYNSEKNTEFIVRDFMKNSALLEEITGKKITALSYPNGEYSEGADFALKKQGIKITFSTAAKSERIPIGNRVAARYNRGSGTDIKKLIAK